MEIVVSEEAQGLKVWKVLDGPRGDSAEKKVRKSFDIKETFQLACKVN